MQSFQKNEVVMEKVLQTINKINNPSKMFISISDLYHFANNKFLLLRKEAIAQIIKIINFFPCLYFKRHTQYLKFSAAQVTSTVRLGCLQAFHSYVIA
jgi:hypothetical protein